jgi:hypothetical protein
MAEGAGLTLSVIVQRIGALRVEHCSSIVELSKARHS